MFKELGQLGGLLKNLPRMREEMDKIKSRLGQIRAEGDAGAGMVRVRVNGAMEVISCTLSDEAIALKDKELLEDLFVGAANQALTKIRQQVSQETAKMAADMGMPPGMMTDAS